MKKIIVFLILVLITLILGAFLRYSQEIYTSITVESPPEPTADNPQWNTILVGGEKHTHITFPRIRHIFYHSHTQFCDTNIFQKSHDAIQLQSKE